MNGSHHPSFEAIPIQLLITIFLAVLLWALYQRLRKVEFFGWWAWAWTCSAVFLGSSIMALRAGPDWNALKIYLLGQVLLFGLLQPLLMVLGGISWEAPNRPLRKLFYSGLLLTLGVSVVAFTLGFLLRADRGASFAV